MATEAAILWDSNTAVVGLAEYKPAPQYTWGYDVNVVAVTPKAGGSVQIRNNGVRQYMYANLVVTINGPTVGTEKVQRGVRFIQAGFIQTLRFANQDATYTSAGGPPINATQFFNGATVDGTTVLDTITDPKSTIPWYSTNPIRNPAGRGASLAALYGGSTYKGVGAVGNKGDVTLQAADFPFMNRQFNPILVPIQPAGMRQYNCTQINFSWQFTTYLAVRTTERDPKDRQDRSASIYTPRASANWTYTRQGAFSAQQPLLPAPVLAVGTGGGAFTTITSGTALPDAQISAPVANIRLNTPRSWGRAPQ